MKAILMTICVLVGIFCLMKFQEAQEAYRAAESVGVFGDIMTGGMSLEVRLEAEQQMRNYGFGIAACMILFIVLVFVNLSPKSQSQ